MDSSERDYNEGMNDLAISDSTESDYDEFESESDGCENNYIYKFTDNQVTVDQNYIITTHDESTILFRHPAVRQIKGSFSIDKKIGFVFFDSIIKMIRDLDGTLYDEYTVPAKFVFHNADSWANFYQQLKDNGYTSPPSESSN